MKQVNVYYPFLLSSFKNTHSLMLSDLKWKAFESHNFLGDGEDWALLIQNMLLEKNPELLKKITFGEESLMFCLSSADKEALQEIAALMFTFYDDDDLLDKYITRYVQLDFKPELVI